MTHHHDWSILRTDYRLSPISRPFADLLLRRGSDPLTVATTAVLLERRRQGHSCLSLPGIAGTVADLGPLDPHEPPPPPWPRFPPLPELVARLASDPAVNDGSTPSVLVLDQAARFYLHRDHCSEQAVVHAVCTRLRVSPPPTPDQTWSRQLLDLFPGVPVHLLLGDPAPGADDPLLDQPRAVLRGLGSPFTLITGGPGTGKTTTVVRLLALLLTACKDLRIALAAPTGKAAARLAQSIIAERSRLAIGDDTRDALPTQVTTLHRLLQAAPAEPRFRHHKDHPLPFDMVVVDEASMVDLTLMAALFEALPAKARIVLIGDQNQLASVEAGDVLGDLCRLASDSEATAAVPALRHSVVRLRHNWRFKDQPGITRLAEAVRTGDADHAVALLRNEEGLSLAQPTTEAEALPLLGDWLDRLLMAPDPLASLLALDQARILCAHRRGPFSVATFEAAIDRLLFARGIQSTRWQHDHRPILITRNDPGTGLYNGDVGVLRVQQEGLHAYFRDNRSGQLRPPITPARLPAHESAFALTVHKSQGSEYEQVLLVLPRMDSPILTRELIYTGLTRARGRVTVVAEEEILRTAIQRVTARSSGIRDAFVRLCSPPP